MRVGTAYRDITPDRPLALQGQMQIRIAKYTRDPLTVNAIVFEQGGSRVALISTDVCVLPNHLAEEIKRAVSDASGIPVGDVIPAATHTHVGPCTTTRLFGDIDPAWRDHLIKSTADAVKSAVDDLEDVELFAGAGWLEHMGWNRRGLRSDGACHMYYGSWRPDFVGIEGPRDGQVGVLAARRPDGSVKAIVSSFSTHPNTLEGESFYCADIPGEVRRVVRAALGDENIGVVYLTGASGNTAPSIMENNPNNVQPWRGELGLKRSGAYLGGEILRVIAAAVEPMSNPVLHHESRTLEIPIREWDEATSLDEYSGGMREFYDHSKADWDRLRSEESPYPVAVHALRVGDAAICTNPAELYCEFGLEIKKRSPAKVTLISELADGWAGYVATPQAIRHGGYSAQASNVARLVPDAGWQIVYATEEMLRTAYANGKGKG